jgi:PAS domain S-box-containing protein
MSAETIKLLRKTPIFSTLDSSSLKRISNFFKERTYSSEQVLFKEGTLGDTLFIIKDGAIKITRTAKEGEEESSRALRREGDIFGESGFIDESPRPATAQAIKTTKVFQLSRSDFLTILNNHPLIAYQIVKVLSSRIKQTDLRQIEELREKNEQLQQACQTLQTEVGELKSQEWSDEKSEPKKEEESLWDRLLSSVPYPVIYTGKDDLVSFFNEGVEREFGYKSEEIMEKPLRALWNEISWDRLSPMIQKELEGKKTWEGEIMGKKKSGEHFLSFTIITQILDPQGRKNGKLYLIQNVTDRRSKEKQARFQEELVCRQRIAGQITDTIRREVKRLSDVYETLSMELDQTNLSQAQNSMTVMRNALDNVKGLISNFTPSASSEIAREPLDLMDLFDEELLLLKSQRRFQDIVFVTHFEEGTPKVMANRQQLQQMLYVILDNAASALRQVLNRTRTITIETAGVNQRQEVQIQISDNGIGISGANLSKVFKERFTTKSGGLGLGLLSVAEIVKDHGGNIEVYSDEGSYTLFVIKFHTYREEQAPLTQIEPAMKAEG